MTSKKLSGGVVVRIRVNPHDCLAILAILEKSQLNLNQSFPSLVSAFIQLTTAFFEQGKHIPEVTGFDYLEKMSTYFPDISPISRGVALLQQPVAAPLSLLEAKKILTYLETVRGERELTIEEEQQYRQAERVVYQED